MIKKPMYMKVPPLPSDIFVEGANRVSTNLKYGSINAFEEEDEDESDEEEEEGTIQINMNILTSFLSILFRRFSSLVFLHSISFLLIGLEMVDGKDFGGKLLQGYFWWFIPAWVGDILFLISLVHNSVRTIFTYRSAIDQ